MVVAVVLLMFLMVFAPTQFGNDTLGNSQSTHPAQEATSQTLYNITFTETGLPSNYGYYWVVILDNNTKKSSTPSISFSVSDGPHNYSVLSTNNYQPLVGNGTVFINGSNKHVVVNFHPKFLLVSFAITNYSKIRISSAITWWAVNFSGTVKRSESSYINFTVYPGHYTYTITAPAGYISSPSMGVLNVSSSNVFVNVTMKNTLYAVTFRETGLPQFNTNNVASEWGIKITGNLHTPIIRYVKSPNLTFYFSKGTYNYAIIAPEGYYAAPASGSFFVNSSASVISVSFFSKLYLLVFHETGLPFYSEKSFGTEWGVVVQNASQNISVVKYTSDSTISFLLRNGTYNYSLISPISYRPGESQGQVALHGNQFYIPVYFSPVFSHVVFQEKGLPSFIPGETNAVWSVTLVNTTSGEAYVQHSNTTTINFRVMPGTYNFTVLPISGYTITNSSGSIAVNGIYLINISFNRTLSLSESGSTSSIMFIESGLPAGTRWTVAVNNSSAMIVNGTSTYQDAIISGLPGGEYIYFIDSVGPYYPNVTSGVINTSLEHVIMINFTFSFHKLIFNESGLPYHFPWSVSLLYPDGHTVYASGITGNISVYVPNGTYIYRFTDDGQFHPVNSLDFKTITGTSAPAITIPVNYTPSMNTVIFSEVGLPVGVSWNITLLYPDGSLHTFDSQFGSIYIPVYNGTYRYFTGRVGAFSPSSFSNVITVNKNTQNVYLIKFEKKAITITFNQRGLPRGTAWTVVINNQAITSPTGSNITYMAFNGTYYYKVNEADGYWSNIMSGIQNVTGEPVIINVTFTSGYTSVKVSETGLPSGSQWYLVLNGTNYTSVAENYTISLQNGTYLFHAVMASNFYPRPGDGLIVVNGTQVNLTINFNPNFYKLKFVPHGLPASDIWSISLSGYRSAFSQAYGSEDISFNVTNGTYYYNVNSASYYVPQPSHNTISIKGSSVVITINFRLYTYPVVFSLTNSLPSGDIWYVNITASNGTVYSGSSTSPVISFSLLNGTYKYSVSSLNKTYNSSNHGYFNVSGSGKAFYVSFHPVMFNVTFSENGLPSNSTWTININGKNETSTSSNITLNLVNGTYSYETYSVGTYNATVRYGTFTVNGKDLSITVTYVAPTHHFVVPPPVSSSGNINKEILYILIGIGAVGLGVIFVVYTKGRSK